MDALGHRRLRRDLDAYVDGELSPDDRSRVAEHLRVCWECSVAAETLRLLKAALRGRRHREATAIAVRRLRRFADQLAGRP